MADIIDLTVEEEPSFPPTMSLPRDLWCRVGERRRAERMAEIIRELWPTGGLVPSCVACMSCIFHDVTHLDLDFLPVTRPGLDCSRRLYSLAVRAPRAVASSRLNTLGLLYVVKAVKSVFAIRGMPNDAKKNRRQRKWKLRPSRW